MAIVAGFDLHRSQITYDALNVATGEIATGRIMPADRATLRAFLQRWVDEDVQVAVEATTGWRFVVEELQRAGVSVQLAEPAETTAARGTKRRAKTDRRDARHLRDLFVQQRVPQAWIAPEHILEPSCGYARRSSSSAPSGCNASTQCCSPRRAVGRLAP